MSSTSIWGEYEPYSNETYSLPLLKHLLRQMMLQFSACGGCIALIDESLGQMKVQVHMRRHNMHGMNSGSSAQQQQTLPTKAAPGGFRPPARRRMTTHLEHDTSSGPLSSPQTSQTPAEEFEDVSIQQTALLAIGSTYPSGRDLIGYAWMRNEAYAMSREEYLKLFHSSYILPS